MSFIAPIMRIRSSVPRIIWFGIMFLAATVVFAQKEKAKKKVDMEYKSAPKSNSMGAAPSMDKLEDARLLIQQAEIVKTANPSLAIEKLERALTLSIEEKNPSNEAHCYRVLAAINLQNGLKESALRQAQKAYELFVVTKDENGKNATRFVLAESYWANSQTDKAIAYLKEHAESNKSKQPTETIRAEYKLAEIYTAQGKNDQALALYQDIIQLEKQRGNKEGSVEANKKIGEVYQSKNQKGRALEYYKQAQDIAEESNDLKSYSEINKNIGEVATKDEALDLRKRSLEKSQEAQNPEVESKENLAIAQSYLEQNQSQTAIPYLKRSLELSSKLGKLEEKGEALKSLSEAYKQQNQFEKAMQTFQKYLAVKDTLLKEKEREIARMLSSNMALAEKQKQIEFLQKDVELNKQTIAALSHEQTAKEERLGRQRVFIYSLIVIIVLIALASYLVYQNAQKRRIANQLLALKSLRSQMNPHFIFNALNSVNNFISKNDERSANKYLADFSKLMRMVMENSEHDFVPLSQEINILKLYLGLEHFRFPEKFDYDFVVDEAIDTDAFEVPPMLIQPYIENAVWHGLRYKTEKGWLEVKFVHNSDQSLSVIITDNGIGRTKSAELKTANQKANHSTGLKTTVSRIRLINELYQKSIRIDIRDLLPEQEDTGTEVVLHLPRKSNRP
jgi:two-component system, LytTR family, sensor kinase